MTFAENFEENLKTAAPYAGQAAAGAFLGNWILDNSQGSAKLTGKLNDANNLSAYESFNILSDTIRKGTELRGDWLSTNNPNIDSATKLILSDSFGINDALNVEEIKISERRGNQASSLGEKLLYENHERGAKFMAEGILKDGRLQNVSESLNASRQEHSGEKLGLDLTEGAKKVLALTESQTAADFSNLPQKKMELLDKLYAFKPELRTDLAKLLHQRSNWIPDSITTRMNIGILDAALAQNPAARDRLDEMHGRNAMFSSEPIHQPIKARSFTNELSTQLSRNRGALIGAIAMPALIIPAVNYFYNNNLKDTGSGSERKEIRHNPDEA